MNINRLFGATAVLVLALAGNPVLADVSGGGAMRMEHDLLGEKAVPASAYYGIQTARAMDNFQISLGPITTEGLRRAIEEPAKKGGWSFAPGLVEQLLRDVGAEGNSQPEPGALPLLSHALPETWKRRPRAQESVQARRPYE